MFLSLVESRTHRIQSGIRTPGQAKTRVHLAKPNSAHREHRHANYCLYSLLHSLLCTTFKSLTFRRGHPCIRGLVHTKLYPLLFVLLDKCQNSNEANSQVVEPTESQETAAGNARTDISNATKHSRSAGTAS